MDATQKKMKQNENLRKAMALNVLANSPEYVNYLLPYLKELSKILPIDPTQYKTEEELNFALRKANARAAAYAELVRFLSQQDAMMKAIRDNIDKPEKSYAI